MENINLDLSGTIDYKAAEKAARNAASQRGAEWSLFAWYDKTKNMGAPQEACSLENWKCVRDFAEHHKADLRISVNQDAFEFYFAKTPADAEQLDKEGVADVHRDIAMDRDENVQGG